MVDPPTTVCVAGGFKFYQHRVGKPPDVEASAFRA